MDNKPLSSLSITTLGAHPRAIAGSSQKLFPTLPFPFEQVVGGVEAVTSRDRVKEDGIIWTDRETTASPFSSWSFLLFRSMACWDRVSFFIPLMRAYFSILYLVAISTSKESEMSNHTKWQEDFQKWTYFFPLDESFLTRTQKAQVQDSNQTSDEDRPYHQNPQFLGQKQG